EYFEDPEKAIRKVHERLEEILEEDRQRAETEELEIQEATPEQAEYPHNEGEETESESDSQPTMAEYDSSLYFQNSHKPVLRELTKAILEAKNGIKLHTLVLDVANLHGLSRTSEKQVNFIKLIIKPWAGMKKFPGGDITVWLSPDDVVDVIPWRGVNAFGDERSWSEIPYPEAIGLAKFACEQRPENPVDFMCEVFALKRRHETTIKTFQAWVNAAQEHKIAIPHVEGECVCPECGNTDTFNMETTHSSPSFPFDESNPWSAIQKSSCCPDCGYEIPAHLGERWNGISVDEAKDRWKVFKEAIDNRRDSRD